MEYKIIIKGFDSGLNELINGHLYDYRTKKYRNAVKNKNDDICCKQIKFCRELKGVHINKPIVIRYPRGGEDKYKFEKHEKIEYGKSELLKQGDDLTILAIGKTVARAMNIADELQNSDIDAEVINVRFLKPLDLECIKKSIQKTKNVITIEDGTIINGLATAIKELIIDENMQEIEFRAYAYPDEYIRHGSVEQLENIYGLDAKSIVEKEIEFSKKLNDKKRVVGY